MGVSGAPVPLVAGGLIRAGDDGSGLFTGELSKSVRVVAKLSSMINSESFEIIFGHPRFLGSWIQWTFCTKTFFALVTRRDDGEALTFQPNCFRELARRLSFCWPKHCGPSPILGVAH